MIEGVKTITIYIIAGKVICHEWATVNLTDQLPRGNSTAVHISNTHIKER